MVLEDQVVLFYIFSSYYASSFDMLVHRVVLQHWVEMAEQDCSQQHWVQKGAEHRCECAVPLVALHHHVVALVVLHQQVVLFSIISTGCGRALQKA